MPVNHCSTGEDSDYVSDEFRRKLAELEQELGVPEQFLEALVQDSDWSFIVKFHAVIEAAITRALVTKSDLPDAHGFFARLELSSSSTGKLVLAEAMGLVPKYGKRYVRALSELRNDFVHDVRNVSVDLVTYFSSLPKERLSSLGTALCYAQPDVPYSALTKAFVRQRLLESPKRAIWHSGTFFLGVLQFTKEIDLYKKQIDDHRRNVGEFVLSHTKSRNIER